MKMEEIDKEMEKIDQKKRKFIKIVKIPRLVQISGKNTQIPRRKPKNPDLVKKPIAGNTDLGSGCRSCRQRGHSEPRRAVICQKLIFVEGDGHCCHRPSSNWETNQSEPR